MAKKIKYYDINKILSYEALYYIIFGERSNGKTYGALQYCLQEYFKNGSEFAYLRRWDDDIKGDRGGSIFNSHIQNGLIKKLSKNKYDDIVYKGRCYYLVKHDENGTIVNQSDKPFAYAFAISMHEHYKGLSYPRIRNIVFDEFLTRGAYLPDEFISFQNVLSTLIRLRDDVKIFMLGNTVNKYSPYIKEMGLYKMEKQLPDTIDLYSYGETGLHVAVEYAQMDEKTKVSNKYFAFNNPRLNMIKNGAWEIDIYPHYPQEYDPPKPKEILFTFFIIFEGHTLACEVIDKDEHTIVDEITNKKQTYPATRFLFIHPFTKEIKDTENTLIYSQESKAQRNYRTRINKPTTNLEKRIIRFFAMDKVFYSDNETGEIMRNYLMWCMSK